MIAGVPLPDWSEREATPDLPYQRFADAAVALRTMDDEARRGEVERYSNEHCRPRLSLSEASGLYVLLRVLFELPTRHPLEATRVFGGWVHPSIGHDPFDLSWPVQPTSGHHLVVAPFTSYRGKGYDGIGEHDWFAEHFPLRTVQKLQVVAVSHG